MIRFRNRFIILHDSLSTPSPDSPFRGVLQQRVRGFRSDHSNGREKFTIPNLRVEWPHFPCSVFIRLKLVCKLRGNSKPATNRIVSPMRRFSSVVPSFHVP